MVTRMSVIASKTYSTIVNMTTWGRGAVHELPDEAALGKAGLCPASTHGQTRGVSPQQGVDLDREDQHAVGCGQRGAMWLSLHMAAAVMSRQTWIDTAGSSTLRYMCMTRTRTGSLVAHRSCHRADRGLIQRTQFSLALRVGCRRKQLRAWRLWRAC